MGQAAAKEVAHGPQYKTNVMFLCNHNSCRSQMADGWLRQLRGDAEVGVASAGIVGGTAVKPGAVEVMREAGVDISSFTSDDIRDFKATEFDIVISCCGCGAKLVDSDAFQAHCGEVEHGDDFAFECEDIFEATYDEEDA